MIKTIYLKDGKVKELAHELLKSVVEANDVVVDATMGNGFDTVFLAGISNNVFAFDVQQQAIDATKSKLDALQLNATLIKNGHENVANYVKTAKAAIFNLGYLPNSDKAIVTKPNTTLCALNKLSSMLLPNGRIAVVIYAGHSGGGEEKQAVLAFAETLDKKLWNVVHYIPENKINPPTLIYLERTAKNH